MDPILIGINHDAPAAVSQWLSPIKWQLFGTLEFPYKASAELAACKFADLVNTMEQMIHTRVCYVYSTETRSKSGAIVPRHLHCALTAVRPISYQLVAGIWTAYVGRADPKGSDLARVEPYDPSRDGVGYIVKKMSDPECSWDPHNVHLFDPSIVAAPGADRVSRRLARRLLAQAA